MSRCQNILGSYQCACPEGLIGDPIITGCRKPGDCFTNSDCPSSAICSDNRCRNPCENLNSCGRNAECLTVNHEITCRCPAKTKGDALAECVPIECSDNNDCSSDKICIDSKCTNPCSFVNACGANADCTVNNHVGICSCKAGYTGDAQLGCVTLQYCATDNQCPSGTKCVYGVCNCKFPFLKFTERFYNNLFF